MMDYNSVYELEPKFSKTLKASFQNLNLAIANFCFSFGYSKNLCCFRLVFFLFVFPSLWILTHTIFIFFTYHHLLSPPLPLTHIYHNKYVRKKLYVHPYSPVRASLYTHYAHACPLRTPTRAPTHTALYQSIKLVKEGLKFVFIEVLVFRDYFLQESNEVRRSPSEKYCLFRCHCTIGFSFDQTFMVVWLFFINLIEWCFTAHKPTWRFLNSRVLNLS